MTNIIEELSSRTRIAKSDVRLIIDTAHKRYKVYRIAKKGALGYRTIAHPARELKALQKAMVNSWSPTLPVHPMATAYEKGTSIVANASHHKSNANLAKFDIKSFFNSIKSHHWVEFLSSLGLDKEYIEVSSKVFFWLPTGAHATCLSVGAPSSPFVSNRIMFQFDVEMSQYCWEQGMAFTRYADDIAVSSNEDIDMRAIERKIIKSFPFEGMFKLNRKKTRLAGKGQRRALTGLIINNDHEVSIGRKRKRIIEAMLHAYAHGCRDKSSAEIKGHLSFLKMVDVQGFERLKRKYSETTNLF